jgi:hypothetical protein
MFETERSIERHKRAMRRHGFTPRPTDVGPPIRLYPEPYDDPDDGPDTDPDDGPDASPDTDPGHRPNPTTNRENPSPARTDGGNEEG